MKADRRQENKEYYGIDRRVTPNPAMMEKLVYWAVRTIIGREVNRVIMERQ